MFESDPVRSAMDKVPSGDFEKDYEILKEMSMEVLRKEGEISPTLFCVGKNKVHIIGGREFPREHDEKVKLFKDIGQHLGGRMDDIYGFFFVSEAWSASVNPGEEAVAPSESPNKVEVLMTCGKKINGDERTEIKLFVRENNKIVFAHEPKDLAELNKVGWRDHKSAKEGEVEAKNFLLDSLWTAYRFSTLLNNLQPNEQRTRP